MTDTISQCANAAVPLLLEGPPGCGKSAAVAAVAAKAGAPLVRVSFNGGTVPMDEAVLGCLRLRVSEAPSEGEGGEESSSEGHVEARASIEYAIGKVWKAVVEGAWLVLDEANLVGDHVLRIVESILSSRQEVMIYGSDVRGSVQTMNKGDSSVESNHYHLTRKVHSKFRLFITINPSNNPEYHDTRHRLTQSFMSHFIHRITQLTHSFCWDKEPEKIILKRLVARDEAARISPTTPTSSTSITTPTSPRLHPNTSSKSWELNSRVNEANETLKKLSGE
eukprot:GHVN01018431.1.p1 GENE.GHVN01018431.1~~GHVN01018431.1.p1  ORF type:complete len:311 (-),score=74.46 GHVN01018431.1:241-1077(-)